MSSLGPKTPFYELSPPTRTNCAICGHYDKIDYYVPDEMWVTVIHPRFQNGYVCHNCFIERADERMIKWDAQIQLFPCSLATLHDRQNQAAREKAELTIQQ